MDAVKTRLATINVPILEVVLGAAAPSELERKYDSLSSNMVRLPSTRTTGSNRYLYDHSK